MRPHICPWWGGYFIDNRFRRLLHRPEQILAPYVKPGMTAMDFGSGMGYFAIPMARLVGDEGRVIAVDLQQEMLDVLYRRATKACVANRILCHRCEADSIGIQARVDFALAFYSAHEVPDLRRLMSQLRACLRHGGRLLLVEPVGHVSASDFRATVCLAEEAGLVLHDRPAICLSRAVLLSALADA